MVENRILYPKDSRVKAAYQGLIKYVLETGKARMHARTAIETIMEHLEMVDDSSTNTGAAPGPNYKKARNYLKTLIPSFVRWTAFQVVEVYVFTERGKRIQTLDALKDICESDPDMSSTAAVNADYSSPWIEQPRIVDPDDLNSHPVTAEIAMIDAEIKRRQLQVQAQIQEAREEKTGRHSGAFRGKEDRRAAGAAVRDKTRITKKALKEEQQQETIAA